MIWDEEGSATVEISILLPFIMLFLIFVLSLTIYVFQVSILTINENRNIQKYTNHERIEREYEERDLFLRKVAKSFDTIRMKFYFAGALSAFHLKTQNSVIRERNLPIDNKMMYMNQADFIIDHYHIYIEGMWGDEE